MPETQVHTAPWLISPPAPPLADGALAVRDGIIVAAGPRNEVLPAHPAARIVEHPGCVLLPGFVNAHTHLELTHFPAWRLRTHVDYHPRRFVDWMVQLIKVKRGIQAGEVPSSVAEGIRMCLESGTTAVGEIVTDPLQASLYRASPLAGRLYFEVLGHDPLRFDSLLDKALRSCADGDSSRFGSGLSPHSPYTIAAEHLPRLAQEGRTRQLPLAIHLAESLDESSFVFDSSGPLAEVLYPFVDWQRFIPAPQRLSPTALLDRAGLLTPATLAVHCVHLTLADAEILKRRGVSVALCPRSNERLDVGRAPVSLFAKLGIPLALGTDSLASNDSLSLWDELRFARQVFPQLSPADLLQMATIGGARALGIAPECGSLQPGKRADFQVVSQAGGRPEELLERLIDQGVVEDVYLAGQRYSASAAGPSLHRRAED